MFNYGQKLVAHQGESYIAPGNSLSSLGLAWVQGAKIVETDMRLTLDEQLIVCHDADFKRVAGDSRTISKHNLADLTNIDIGVFKAKQWEGQTPPTLKQVLEQAIKFMPEDGQMFLEVKDDTKAIAPLKKLLDKIGKQHKKHWIITSFNKDVIAGAHEAMPNIETSWITKITQDIDSKQKAKEVADLIQSAKQIKANRISLPKNIFTDSSLVKAIHNEGLKLATRTVDEPKQVRQLIDLGIDTVTTNRRHWVAKQLDGD